MCIDNKQALKFLSGGNTFTFISEPDIYEDEDDELEEKKCTKCGILKPYFLFDRDRKHVTGRCTQCKQCVSERKKSFHAANPHYSNERSRKWRLNNPVRYKESLEAWRAANQDKILASRERQYAKRREQALTKNAH